MPKIKVGTILKDGIHIYKIKESCEQINRKGETITFYLCVEHENKKGFTGRRTWMSEHAVLEQFEYLIHEKINKMLLGG